MKTKRLPVSLATIYELLILTLLVIIGSSCGGLTGGTNGGTVVGDGCMGCAGTDIPPIAVGVAVKTPYWSEQVSSLPQINGIWSSPDGVTINSPAIKVVLVRDSDF